eukprot:scaffold3291_cov165-Alexandrium_tamarense.AAC.1
MMWRRTSGVGIMMLLALVWGRSSNGLIRCGVCTKWRRRRWWWKSMAFSKIAKASVRRHCGRGG